jgi:hypothetical protein
MAIVALAKIYAPNRREVQMTLVMVEIKPETAQHIHALLDMQKHARETFATLGGRFLDNHVAYQLEIDRMRPIDMYGLGIGFPQGGDA